MDESPLVYRATVVSDDSNFDISTALFHVTMQAYRQFARKVGTSANSALIRYYLPRLKLSSSTRVSEGTKRLVIVKTCDHSQPFPIKPLAKMGNINMNKV